MKNARIYLSLAEAINAVSLVVLTQAAHASDLIETAQVVSSAPIYREVREPRQECWAETSSAAPIEEKSYTGAIIGGIAGAIAGNQIGDGSGRTAATAVGAAAGALIGDRVSNPNSAPVGGGAIAGAAVGGILGSQVGSGSGSDVAAGVGAASGAIIGDRVTNPSQAKPGSVQKCRQVDTVRQEITGYTVVYRYNGRDITTTMPYQPASTVRVGVGIIADR
ncbi:MAG: glycine zipper 2TM domain-containing protein [Pseudomonadota bacterium]